MIPAALLLSCAEPGPATDPAVRALGPQSCPSPERRREAAFDHLLLPGPAADEDRFWGAGAVAADLDGDRDPDLFLPGPIGLRLWWNDGQGGFREAPDAVPDEPLERVVGAAAADVDGDGDLDLAVTRFGLPDLLLENLGGRFVEARDPVVSGPSLHSQSPAFGDLDLDGDLDLVIAGHGPVESVDGQVVVPGPGDRTRVLLREGATWVDDSDRIPDFAHGSYTFVASVVTLDADPHPDLVLANDYPAWRSGLALTGSEEGLALAPELGLDLMGAGMGVAAEDANGDGLDDLLIPVWDDVALLRSDADLGRWIDATRASGAALRPHQGAWVGWGAEWVDLDLDGDLDAVIASGHLTPEAERTAWGIPSDNEEEQTYTVLLREGEGFVEATEDFGLDQPGTWRGFAVADLNGDGWPDLARRDLRGPTWVDLSRCGEEAWLTVRPVPPERAVGARVVVRTGGGTLHRTVRAGGTSLASGGPPEVRFGLGSVDRVEAVEVLWPDGTAQPIGAWRTRQVLEVRHPEATEGR